MLTSALPYVRMHHHHSPHGGARQRPHTGSSVSARLTIFFPGQKAACCQSRPSVNVNSVVTGLSQQAHNQVHPHPRVFTPLDPGWGQSHAHPQDPVFRWGACRVHRYACEELVGGGLPRAMIQRLLDQACHKKSQGSNSPGIFTDTLGVTGLDLSLLLLQCSNLQKDTVYSDVC
jgi:hypothetical protein